jgi:hypothetical protein
MALELVERRLFVKPHRHPAGLVSREGDGSCQSPRSVHHA